MTEEIGAISNSSWPKTVKFLAKEGYSEHQQRQYEEILSKGSGLLVIAARNNFKERNLLGAIRMDVPDNKGAFYLRSEIHDRATGAKALELVAERNFVLSMPKVDNCIDFYQLMVSYTEIGVLPNVLLSDDCLVGLVSQSSVELLCQKCSKDKPHIRDFHTWGFGSAEELLAAVNEHLDASTDAIRFRHYGNTYCHDCGGQGVTGWTRVAEVFPIDDVLRALLQNHNYEDLPAWMKSRQIESRYDHALTKALDGKIDPLNLFHPYNPRNSRGPNILMPRWTRR